MQILKERHYRLYAVGAPCKHACDPLCLHTVHDCPDAGDRVARGAVAEGGINTVRADTQRPAMILPAEAFHKSLRYLFSPLRLGAFALEVVD